MTLRLTAATTPTRLTIELRTRTQGTTGRPASHLSLARLPKTVSAGAVALRIALSPRSRQALLAQATATLEIVIRGTSTRAKLAVIRRSITLQGG